MGGRGANSAMSSSTTRRGFGNLVIKSNAQVFDGISNVPNKIGENQRWVLMREYSTSDGFYSAEFEGKGTSGGSDHDRIAELSGFKSTSSMKTNYKRRTEATKVGKDATSGFDTFHGRPKRYVTANNYKPVLVTLGSNRSGRR